MKKVIKVITVLAITLMVFAIPSYVLAQNGQKNQGGQQQAGTGNKGMGTAAQNLNRVVERANNPEVGEQIRSMVQNHEKIQVRTQTALHQMSQRKQALKLLIGPDYKNAGQVRSDVVGLKNDVRKLELLKDKSLPEDVEDIQGAINDLQLEATGLEVQLDEQLSGFSLFGWLSKMLAE